MSKPETLEPQTSLPYGTGYQTGEAIQYKIVVGGSQ